MKVRRAVPADLDAVTELTRYAYSHYLPILGGEPVPMTEDYAPRIAVGEVWLLEDDGAAIGLIVIEESSDHLHVFSVAVTPERQSEGLGRKLLAFAEEMARELGRPSLTLCTGEKMRRNIEIYRRFGFVETRRRPNPRRPGWVLVDMEKTLGTAGKRRSV